MRYIDGVASFTGVQAPTAAPHRWRQRYVRAATAVGAALVATFAVATSAANAQVGRMPTGWYAVGAGTGDYLVGTDLSRRDGGQGEGGGTIRSLVATPRHVATLQQSIRADLYRGQRVRLSGFLKTGAQAGTFGMASLWMRVDGPSGLESTDYMQDRPIMQNTAWARYEVVLDVPPNAVGISLGALLEGQGQVWLDDVALEPVGLDVPLTGRPGPVVAPGNSPGELRQDALRLRHKRVVYRDALLRPVNLGFLEGTRTP
ncbi:hypothetical protein [Gemmatirosa kalamazoonensis]|nr:hypothetical protein [Gemmatirosa kalamazoonensis]